MPGSLSRDLDEGRCERGMYMWDGMHSSSLLFLLFILKENFMYLSIFCYDVQVSFIMFVIQYHGLVPGKGSNLSGSFLGHGLKRLFVYELYT